MHFARPNNSKVARIALFPKSICIKPTINEAVYIDASCNLFGFPACKEKIGYMQRSN